MALPSQGILCAISFMKKMLEPKLLSYFVFFSCFTLTLSSQETNLTLQECLRLGTQNSIDLRVAGYLPDIAEGDIFLAESPYDIFLTSSYEYSKTDSRLLQQKRGIFSLGLTKRFETGTLLSLGYDLEYRHDSELENSRELNALLGLYDPNDFDNLWTSGVSLRVSQSLLRNFGFGPNKALIRAAEKQKNIAQYEVERVANELLSQVEIAYWAWICTLKNLEVINRSVAKAKQFVQFTEERAGKVEGVLPSDVSDALVNLQNREDTAISTAKDSRIAADRLRRLIYPFNPQNPGQMDWDKVLVAPDSAKAEFAKVEEIPSPAVEDALKYRVEVKQTQEKIRTYEILVERNRNQLLPSLDVLGGVTFLGEEPTGPGRAMRKGFNGDHYRWSVGVAFEYPLGNLAARGELRKAQAQMEQAESELHKVQYDICLQIRESWHEVQAARARYEKSKSTLDNAEKSLASLERRYDRPLQGDFNLIFFLQDAESKRTEAHLVQNQSLLEYRIAIAKMKQAQAWYLREVYAKYKQ